MLEKRIAKSTLRFFGVEQPTREDVARFITKFNIDKMRTGKKIMLGMGGPMLLSLLEYRMWGIFNHDEPAEKERRSI